jgi:hypothetical protein
LLHTLDSIADGEIRKTWKECGPYSLFFPWYYSSSLPATCFFWQHDLEAGALQHD